ncbi:MAG: presenilin-like A22 family membrane protease [Candidatus Promineifilaceae bacterium]|jgi:presenilin-like A22 family membrane protease
MHFLKNKWLILTLSIWQLLYIFLFVGLALLGPSAGKGPGPVIVWMHYISMVLNLGLFIFYIVQINDNPRIRDRKQVIWIFSILFLSPVSMLYYWFKYILNSV